MSEFHSLRQERCNLTADTSFPAADQGVLTQIRRNFLVSEQITNTLLDSFVTVLLDGWRSSGTARVLMKQSWISSFAKTLDCRSCTHSRLYYVMNAVGNATVLPFIQKDNA